MNIEVLAPRRGRQGVALATSLMLAVLILVLGTTLLTSSQRDLFFQRQQQARDKAELLARSGLEFAAYLLGQGTATFNSTLAVDTPQTYQVNGTTEVFILERKQDPVTFRLALQVTGLVRRTNGDELARRTLVVPYGSDNFLSPSELETQVYGK